MSPKSKDVVLHQVYRSLIKLGRKFDRNAQLKALVSSRFYEDNAGATDFLGCFNWFLSSTLLPNHASYYVPTTVSLTKHIQQQFRMIPKNNTFTEDDHFNAAFLTMKKLNLILQSAEKLNLPVETEPPDHSSSFAPFVRLSRKLGPGTFLLAHPMVVQPFYHSVIFLTECSDGGPSKGYIINRPMGNIHLQANSTKQYMLHFGGPLKTNIEYIHGDSKLEGSIIDSEGQLDKEPNPDENLYFGGDLSVVQAAPGPELKGLTDSSEVIFFESYAGWESGQLQAEMQQGTWIPVYLTSEAEKKKILFSDKANLWQKMMHSLGGEYSQFSVFRE